jgi:hypothetical protein
LDSTDVKELFRKYVAALSNKASLETEKKTARASLDDYSSSIPADYETSINLLLERFNCDFRLCSTRRENKAGKPSLSWSLKFDDHELSLAASMNPDGPTFGTVLSGGDRSALAFAFFATQVAGDVTLAEACVVFDDPFTSQDAGRRSQTVSEIVQITRKAKQMIVLSHEDSFLREVYDRAPDRGQVKTLTLRKVSGSIQIEEHDLVAASESMSTRDLRDLEAFLQAGDGDPLNVIRKLRPSLETWLRKSCVGAFPETSGWLGDMLETLRDSTPGDAVSGVASYYQEIADINDYSKKYHHGEPSSDKITAPDEEELAGFTCRTVKLLKL